MMKKIIWKSGDVFAVPLKNGSFAIGQVLDSRIINCLRCVFYCETIDNLDKIEIQKLCQKKDMISLVEVTREQLDYNVWKVIGNKPISIPLEKFPNEDFRNNEWIGSITYDAALAEDFLNAFYCQIPWNDWFNPNFLDEFLIDISLKPKKLILIEKKA